MPPLIVVTNRLPVQPPARGRGAWVASPGGLAAALHPALAARGGRWVGWSGGKRPAALPTDLGYDLEVIDLEPGLVRGYYDGFSNATLWPLYHDVVRPPVFHREWWNDYREVNLQFAESVAAGAEPGAVVWVHDYHLQLVPQMLRERRPDLRLGFFLHIPFPSSDLFMQLPWRRQVLEGIAGADVIGFQTASDARNFRRSWDRFAADGTAGPSGPPCSTIGVFPISVDVAHWDDIARRPETTERAIELGEQLGNPRHVLLGIDRLDYTKGIEHRLRAFRELLAEGTVSVPDTVMVQVAVPSRDRTAAYRTERVRIEQLVGEINGTFGQVGAPAVHYIHRSLRPEEIAALYRTADVMLVTPVQDGMNLVAKEFVSCRIADRGVLLLSEFAGAADELDAAVLVNPHDIDGIKRGIVAALTMPDDEVAHRMRRLRAIVAGHTVHDWADSFLDRLTEPRAA